MGFTGTDYGAKAAKKLDKAWKPAAQNASNLFLSANQNQLRALGKIAPSFQGAKASLQSQASLVARDINDASTQTQGLATQSFVSSGLYNTTAYDTNRRALRLTRQRSMAELDRSLAEQSAALEAAQGQAIAAQRGQIASTKMNYAQVLAAMATKKSNQYAKILYGKQGGLAGPLAQLAGTAVGLVAGSKGGTENDGKVPFKGNNGPIVNSTYNAGGY